MKTIIAVIRDTEIVNKIIFDEETAQAALDIAKQWLDEGVFALLGADEVQIIPCTGEPQYNANGDELPANDYGIEDYFLDDHFEYKLDANVGAVFKDKNMSLRQEEQT